MKKILYLLLLLPSLNLFSQAPQRINYQSVVRNAAGNSLTNQAIALRFSIHTGTANGSVIYSETANTTTNQFGLATLEIGAGGNLSLVNWSNGAKYLQVDLDPNGGTNFTPMDTSQLLSVPYALFAGNNMAGPTGATGATGVGVTGPTGATGATGNNGGGSVAAFPNTTVYTGNLPVNYWQTLDVSSVVGANNAIVCLKITKTGGSTGSGAIDFRQFGDTAVYGNGGYSSDNVTFGQIPAVNSIGTLFCTTDSHGWLNWRAQQSIPVRVDVVSFIK